MPDELPTPASSHLANLPKLKRLSLRATFINGSGMSAVAKLKDLEDVDLSQTEVGDGALKHLADKKRLKTAQPLVHRHHRQSGLAELAGPLTELDLA